MNVTKGMLRRLVTEALDAQADQKGFHIAGQALRAAKHFVEGIVVGERDGAQVDDMKAKAKELEAYSRFLTQRDGRYAALIAEVAKHVSAIVGRSGLLSSTMGKGKLDYKDAVQKELYAGRKAFTELTSSMKVDSMPKIQLAR